MAARTRLPLLVPRNVSLLRNPSCVSTEAAAREPGYPPAEAVYPPVVASLTAKSKSARLRQIEEQVKKIRAAPVAEKLSLITRTQRLKFVVYPQTFARNADKWYQHFTKTAYIPGLPAKFTREAGAPPDPPAGTRAFVPGIDGETFADIRSLVQRVILQDECLVRRRRAFLFRHQEQTVGPFLRNLLSQLRVRVSVLNPLLQRSRLDFSPAVNFYWRRGRRVIPKGHRRGRPEPIRFQIDDQPLCQIRITEQLPQFAPLESSYEVEVPEVKLAPNLMPLFRRQYENHIFTGAKLPDPACYGHTQFHLVPDRFHRERRSDQQEVFLRANALASLFAWTGAQATYQGFWNHEDVTRPFVSQAIISDGIFFSFFCYQLNTVALSVETDVDNPRTNLLWGSGPLQLYRGVEDGKVVGLNDDVLALLLQFLLNRP